MAIMACTEDSAACLIGPFALKFSDHGRAEFCGSCVSAAGQPGDQSTDPGHNIGKINVMYLVTDHDNGASPRTHDGA
jgi:hypothetical protein